MRIRLLGEQTDGMKSSFSSHDIHPKPSYSDLLVAKTERTLSCYFCLLVPHIFAYWYLIPKAERHHHHSYQHFLPAPRPIVRKNLNVSSNEGESRPTQHNPTRSSLPAYIKAVFLKPRFKTHTAAS